MRQKVSSVVLVVLILGISAALLLRRSSVTTTHHGHTMSPASPSSSQNISTAMEVPAHYETAPPLTTLGATLPPEEFDGQAREAYQVAREAPQLIAQMPCYCHCDRSLHHKSLHSCFEDDHAATCATCIEEALMAYRLQQRGISPKQIRETIIAQFGN